MSKERMRRGLTREENIAKVVDLLKKTRHEGAVELFREMKENLPKCSHLSECQGKNAFFNNACLQMDKLGESSNKDEALERLFEMTQRAFIVDAFTRMKEGNIELNAMVLNHIYQDSIGNLEALRLMLSKPDFEVIIKQERLKLLQWYYTRRVEAAADELKRLNK